MVAKALLILATVMAVGHALPNPADQLQVTEVKAVPEVVEVPVQYAEERGDLLSGGDLLAAADNSGDAGWGWQPAKPVVQSGWGWPKFKYLKFTIPIPILPRIKFGIKGGLRLNAAIQHPKGWGWSR